MIANDRACAPDHYAARGSRRTRCARGAAVIAHDRSAAVIPTPARAAGTGWTGRTQDQSNAKSQRRCEASKHGTGHGSLLQVGRELWSSTGKKVKRHRTSNGALEHT